MRFRNYKLFLFLFFSGAVGLAAAPAIAAAPTTNLVPDVPATCTLQFPSQNLCAALLFDTPPVVGKEAKFHVLFRSTETGFLTDPAGDVSLRLWMPDMGHGSSPVLVTHAADVGTFDISKAYFLMRGNWEIHVEVKTTETTESAFVVELL